MSAQEALRADRAAARAPAGGDPARPAPEGRFARVGGQNLLFSPARQQVFTLNDTAADIWQSLEDGASPEAVAAQMARRGVDAREARRHVEAALREWERLDLIRPGPPPAAAARGRVSQVVALAGVRVRIVYPAAHAAPAAAVFRHLEADGAAADTVLELVERGGRLHLFRDRGWIGSCAADEIAPVVRAQLLGEVLGRAGYEIALHAAALLRGGRTLLLCGGPGAGKTTLALGLARAGFGYAGDDVTLLDSRGAALGLPFAPAVKAGAWRLLAGCCPGLGAAPVFRRPDRRRVRYPVPGGAVRCPRRAVGWVVLLRRGGGAPPSLEPVDAAGALRGLLEGSFAPGRELTGPAFDVLVRVIGSAQVHRLTYTRLEDAVELIGRACR